ncbi:uncharacterized protein LOC132624355 [Lycium barbarum]|uniref:uncharacterized protein LOC132624355 n=1 Tax=Lycium barbarum TaxID=112863 RepID=UPI00293F5EB5|nr:uncharacterized protein LOC132624355 [Lycium barbarum]
MEYLSRLLKTLQQDPNFNYHPRCEKLNLVQFSFADDLLLFCRGDVLSVQMLFNCFKEFSEASGLKANLEKSSIYFGGVPMADQESILELTGFTRGELPIRYLGVPLSTKRISVNQCKPLLDKMLGRISTWTTKYLSYVGRVQLIKSVLFSIQTFWARIFLLPNKIIQMIEAICRRFLWTEGVEVSKKALLAWEKMCYPRSAGGLNILDILQWNRAAVCKLLWNLRKKKDKLWVKWLHIYYGKGRSMWGLVAGNASWVVRKILKAKVYLENVGIQEQDLIQMEKFSIKKVYVILRGPFQKVPWRKVVCNNFGAAKWIFILRLIICEKLLTRDKLATWGITDDTICPLCNHEDESIAH